MSTDKMSQIKTQCGHRLGFVDVVNREKIIIESKGDLKRTIYGDKIKQVSGHDVIEIRGDAVKHVLSGGYTIEANERIKLQCGESVIEISVDGIVISSANIKLLTQGEQSVKPLAIKGSYHSCPVSSPTPHQGGTILQGSNNVFIAGNPAARLGDQVQCHGAIDMLDEGMSNLLINNKPAVCVGHTTEHGGIVLDGIENTVAS